MNYTYVSIDRIFSKVSRDLKTEFQEDDIVEWCGEALEFIGAVKSGEEAVAFIEVKNHQCDVPRGLHNIIQIARSNKWTGSKDPCITPCIVAANLATTDCVVKKPTIADPCLCPPADAVWLDCNGTPIVEYDLAYYRPFFDLQFEYFGWCNSSYCQQDFSPVRLATSSFFNSLVCTTQKIPYNSCQDEYTIVQGSKLRFSFRDGFVAVAYNRQIVDIETGYPMIPDNISYTTAITKYVNMMVQQKRFYEGRDGAKGMFEKAESDWQWYCGQASNVDKMPYGLDEYQNLLEQRSYLLPNNNSYYGFFGKLASRDTKSPRRVSRGDYDQIKINNTDVVNNYYDTGGELIEKSW